jgi:tetratricopeptide (TPR) repeat protein
MLAAGQPAAFDFAMAKETLTAVKNHGSRTLRDFSLGALLLVVTFIVYLPSLKGGFLWDDDGHITQPGLRSLHGLWRIWFEVGATQQYYPLLHSAFWIEHRLWGDAVMGYHLANVFLHAAAACLVVAIMRKLALPGAWLAGFIFALHPVCVESVAWISEQKNTLSAVFYLGAALIYLDFDRQRRWPQYFLATGLFALALLSKTVTATLPAALLVIFWWQRGRLSWKQDVLPLLPWLVLGAGGGLFSAWVERKFIGAEGAGFQLTLLERGLLAGRVGWFYAGKLIWPADLIFIYPHWTVSPALWWQYLFPLGVMALGAGLWLWARRRRGPLAASLFFLGTLFPVLGFFNVYPFIFSYVADHFQYLACLGIIVPAASGLTMVGKKIPEGRRWLAPALAGALLLTLGVLTSRQAGEYRDAQTIYRETLARNPDCWMAHNNLGCILETMPGRLPEAIGHFDAALRLKPNFADAHNNLGNVLAAVPGRLPEAIGQFEAALRLKPDFAEAHNNLGNALATIPGLLPEAISHFETALRLKPDFAEAQNNLGTALANIPGQLPEAVKHFETAVQLRPDYTEAFYNLGKTLAEIPGRQTEAVSAFEAALRLEPKDAAVHSHLGSVLANIPGRLPEAIGHFETALQIEPDNAVTHYNLGIALNEVGRTAEAISHFKEAVRLNPGYAEAHYNLGTSLGQSGQMPEAISELEEAVRLNPDYAEAHHNLGLALYEAGRTSEAIDQFKEVLRIRPDSPDVRAILEKLQNAAK